jgi:hypothetical protein
VAADEDPILKLRGEDMLWRRLESEIVILDGESWEYLALNESAGLVWERLQTGATRSELIQLLFDTYGVASDTATHDVDAFIESLRARSFLAP